MFISRVHYLVCCYLCVVKKDIQRLMKPTEKSRTTHNDRVLVVYSECCLSVCASVAVSLLGCLCVSVIDLMDHCSSVAV